MARALGLRDQAADLRAVGWLAVGGWVAVVSAVGVVGWRAGRGGSTCVQVEQLHGQASLVSRTARRPATPWPSAEARIAARRSRRCGGKSCGARGRGERNAFAELYRWRIRGGGEGLRRTGKVCPGAWGRQLLQVVGRRGTRRRARSLTAAAHRPRRARRPPGGREGSRRGRQGRGKGNGRKG